MRPRGEEEWARRCITAAIGGVEVRPHDDGSEPAMFDLEIVFEGRRRGAVEVTAAADAESIELWNLINGHDERWIEPHLAGGWSVVLHPHARAKRVMGQLPAFLAELELAGVHEVRVESWPSGPFDDLAQSLGIAHLFQGGTDYPGSIYPTIELPDEKSGGMVSDSGDALAIWLTEWIGQGRQEHNLKKLDASHSDERHLFVILPGFADAPFAVVDLLMRGGAPLPTTPPTLPEEVTHVWVLSTWSSGDGMRWSPDVGWERFHKQVGGAE